MKTGVSYFCQFNIKFVGRALSNYIFSQQSKVDPKALLQKGFHLCKNNLNSFIKTTNKMYPILLVSHL